MLPWWDKQRHLIDYSARALARRRGRSLGLLLVYTAILFLLASVMLFSHAIKQEAQVVLKGAPEIMVQRMIAGRHDLIPADYAEPLRRIRGVRDVTPRLWGYFYDATVAANYTVMVPTDRELDAGRIVIGAGLARARGAEVGDILSLTGADGEPFSFQIAEVLSHQSELVSADLLLMGEADYRTFFRLPEGLFTDITLTVRNAREVRTVAQKVVAALPDTRPILREEVLRTYDSLFDWREGMMLVLLAGSVLAFVLFAWDKASGLSAEERREIGILKAVGWETADVIRMKMWEGALVSLAAFLLGYVAAYIHVFHMAGGLFEPVLKGWAVLYPAFRPAPFIDGFQVVTLFFFTVVPYTVATVVPIWRAAIIDPDQVMRS